jgi:hypothetical protein
MRFDHLAYSLVLALGACTGNPGSGPEIEPTIVPPAPITFQLQNDAPSALFIYMGCNPDLTLTELTTPAKILGLPVGCGICDCAAATCPQVVCGACYAGSYEIPATSTMPWSWSPVDMSYEPRGTTTCSHTRGLPAGRYRIDVPVYERVEDAMAKVNGRVVTREFTLPADGPVVVPLAAGP